MGSAFQEIFWEKFVNPGLKNRDENHWTANGICIISVKD
jgi:hypothetical protein